MGAIVAAGYMLIKDEDELADVLTKFGSRAFRLTVPRSSLLSSAGIREVLQRYARDVRIEDCETPLAIVAADLHRQQEVVFRNGLLWPAVMASFAIPGAYPPVRMGKRILVDGSVLDPVPTQVAEDMGANVVVGVKLSGRPIAPDMAAEATPCAFGGPTLLQVLMGEFGAMQRKISIDAAQAATIIVTPQVQGTSTTQLRNFAQGRRLVPNGEQATMEALPRLRAVLPWLHE